MKESEYVMVSLFDFNGVKAEENEIYDLQTDDAQILV